MALEASSLKILPSIHASWSKLKRPQLLNQACMKPFCEHNLQFFTLLMPGNRPHLV